jgi:hypothetical protein
MDFEGRIILAQSAVGPAYEAMLEATRGAHQVFADRNRLEFVSTSTVLRGFHPWQAAYNRIVLIEQAVRDGFDGWFMHLDADAVIRHPDFDIRRYFGKRGDRGLIACLGSPESEPWAVNDGVFFLNLGHDDGRRIARRWHDSFMRHVTDDMLRLAVAPWQSPDGSAFPDDQHLLQMELMRDPSLSVLHEDPMLINHRGARFIRQFLRAHGTDEQRLQWIRESL